MSYEMPSMPPMPPVGGPGMPPPPVESLPVIPAFPPVQLFSSPSGLVWVFGNDYTRGWNGVMWVPLG